MPLCPKGENMSICHPAGILQRLLSSYILRPPLFLSVAFHNIALGMCEVDPWGIDLTQPTWE